MPIEADGVRVPRRLRNVVFPRAGSQINEAAGKGANNSQNAVYSEAATCYAMVMGRFRSTRYLENVGLANGAVFTFEKKGAETITHRIERRCPQSLRSKGGVGTEASATVRDEQGHQSPTLRQERRMGHPPRCSVKDGPHDGPCAYVAHVGTTLH